MIYSFLKSWPMILADFFFSRLFLITNRHVGDYFMKFLFFRDSILNCLSRKFVSCIGKFYVIDELRKQF